MNHRLRTLLVPVVLLLLVLPLAWPCGPYFNDAHHGLARDPLQGSFEGFYVHLLRPGTALEPLAAAEHEAERRAVAAEKGQHWDEAAAAWRAALQTMGYDAEAVHAWRIRAARDRCDLLPLVGRALTIEQWRAYAVVAGPQIGGDRPRSVAREPFLDLAASADAGLAAAALTTLGWRELLAGNVAVGQADLANALARDAHGAKSDEASYLLAVAPVFAHLDQCLRVDEPAAALAAIQAWVVAHPASPWRPHALGWQAAILYHHPGTPWNGASDGLGAATRIWQGLLEDPAASELFTSAAESLRFAYRKLRPQPPAWVVADARHAAAFAWHAVTDHAPLAERRAALAAAEPALERSAAGMPDSATALALAETWFHAGRVDAALPLARRAFALGDTPESRSLLARLEVEGGDVEAAERLAAPAPTFDLLTRIGSAWEGKQEWGKALAAYARANSAQDVSLLVGGEMPLAALMELVAGGGPFVAALDYQVPWAGGRAEVRAGHDFIPELRRQLAIRLVRADRAKEALPFFDDGLRGSCAGLIALQDDLAAATDAQRPDRLYALAAFWYDQGRRLVFSDPGWHQWAYGRYFRSGGPSQPASPSELASRARFAAEMEAMTVYHRAYPMFLELAERYPHHAHAADALYKAALCRYWLTAQTYLKYCEWWVQRAQRERYWDQGDALLRRLAATYPDDPLAQDPKVVRAVAGEVPKR